MTRCSSTGTRPAARGRDPAIDELIEQHLPKLALFCLRFTQDREQAAALAERVLLKARRKIADSRGAQEFSGSLHSVLREECLTPVGVKSAVAVADPLCTAKVPP
jgi:DNA-directed RNA polymerase specialized sigma24 family protein